MANLKRRFSELSEDSNEEPSKFQRVDVNEQVNLLNQHLTQIIEGQEDVTTDPEVAAKEQMALVTTLNKQLNNLITAKEERQRKRQEELRMQEAAMMNQIVAREIISENAKLIGDVVRTLASSQARLPRAERIMLNKRIESLIMDTITTYEVREQLQNEPALTPIKQLFDGLIKYYTEMASYGYEHSPEILAKFGSIVAGSAVIGSTIYAPETISQNSGALLIYLSSYFRTAAATASGLYLLQRGGLPVPEILQNIGTKTLECLKTGCDVVANETSKILNLSLDALGSYLTQDYQNIMIVYDPDSQSVRSEIRDSSGLSVASNNSSAGEAVEAIDDILDVPDADRIRDLRQELEAAMQGLQQRLEEMPEEIDIGSPIMLSPLSSPESSQPPTPEDLYGGRRKSRRHMKIKKSRKGRKGRKHRVTRKGRKHHRTLKRYRSKMRR